MSVVTRRRSATPAVGVSSGPDQRVTDGATVTGRPDRLGSIPQGTAIRVRPGTTTTGPSARSMSCEELRVQGSHGPSHRPPDRRLECGVGRREGMGVQVAGEPVGQRRDVAGRADMVHPGAARRDDQEVLLAALCHPDQGLFAARREQLAGGGVPDGSDGGSAGVLLGA